MSVYLDLLQGRNSEDSIATEGLKEVGARIKKAFSSFVGKIIGWIDKVCQWFKNHKPESKKNLREENARLSKENDRLRDSNKSHKNLSDSLMKENEELYNELHEKILRGKKDSKEKMKMATELSNEKTRRMTDNANTSQGSSYVKQIMDILSLTIKASSAYNTQISTFQEALEKSKTTVGGVGDSANVNTFKNNFNIIEDCLDKMNNQDNPLNDSFHFNPQMAEVLVKGLVNQLEKEKAILTNLKTKYDKEIAPLYDSKGHYIDQEIQRVFNRSTSAIQNILGILVKTINWTKKATE